MTVTLLYFDGCPNWQAADERLAVLADELGHTVVRRKVETPEEAERIQFRGSPTILVEGNDPFARGDEPTGLACRIYETPQGTAGVPTLEQLRTALERPPRPAARLEDGYAEPTRFGNLCR